MRVAFGLGAIQLAVTLGWMAYAHFQPRILDDIGLSRLDTLLAVYVAAAGTMLGPLAGGLADLTVRRAGSRFPVVVAGGFLAGVLFVAVALAIGPYAPGPLRDAIPVLIVLWIAAMIVLQAPSLAWPAISPAPSCCRPSRRWSSRRCSRSRSGRGWRPRWIVQAARWCSSREAWWS